MNAWLKRKAVDEIIRVVPDPTNERVILCYKLFLAYEDDYLGRILFDTEGYWIYDGDELTIDEQEQVARFIIYNMDRKNIVNY